MDKTTMNICIGGEAGQGLVTIGQVLAKALVRKGYHLHVTQVYESRIRGGHNTFVLRVGSVPVAAPTEEIDLLIALDKASLPVHREDLASKALILSDDSLSITPDSKDFKSSKARHLSIPLADMGKGARQNTVMLGGVSALLGLDKEDITHSLMEYLANQTPAVRKENELVLEKAYNWLAEQKSEFPPLSKPTLPKNSNMMLHGNEAIAMGAIAAGLKFCSFYPMSPATTVSLTVADFAKRMGIVVEQVEDEIAAINMALGASYAGARAMTASSGGGFALMCEGVSLAGITETPIVIVVAMRPGPATGLPTRTEQGDLDLVMYAGHGEFPRAVFAPATLQECFDLTRQAFVMAEKYQGPVFVLTDQYLTDSYRQTPPFALDTPPLPVGLLESQGNPDAPGYERYAMSKDGISPRRIPGLGKSLVVLDSDEHTPDGHITEDLSVRVAMQDKRMTKLQGLTREAVSPTFTGPDEVTDILLVCWGSTKGAVEEAAEIMRAKGDKVSVCHFSQVYPLQPESFIPRFNAAKKVVMVESNFRGQMAGLIQRETGFSVQRMVLRYDGLPMTPRYIINHLAADKSHKA